MRNPRFKRMEVQVNERDRTRLELIREVFGISFSAALRVAIRAAAEKLGLERPSPDDFLNKK